LIVPLVVRMGFGVVEIDVYVDGAVVVTGNEMTANDIKGIRDRKSRPQKKNATNSLVCFDVVGKVYLISYVGFLVVTSLALIVLNRIWATD
jgi:hypothetical protein